MLSSSSHTRTDHKFSDSLQTAISAIPFLAVALALIYWVPIIWLKYITLHDYVFDLGVFYGSLHSIFYIHSSSILYQYAAGSALRIILSPLSVFNSFILLLYIQLVLVLGSAITVYLISRRIFRNSIAPVLISIAYLLYFPINGSIFFDVHAQTFFLPFMLLAYYLEISGRYKLSFVLFILAGLTRFPIIGIVVLYSMADFIYNFRTGYRTTDRTVMRTRMKFDMALFFAAFIITLLQYYANTYVLGVSSMGNIHYVAGASFLGGSLGTDLITVLIFSAPLLLLPLFYSEFSLILWALFGFAFYTNYSGYLYPSVFTDQYSALFVPLIFISVFAGLMAKRQSDAGETTSQPLNISRRGIDAQFRTAIKIFVAIAIFAMLFQPYSPLAAHTNGALNISDYTTAGQVTEPELQSVINLIPASATGIVFGGNMPEIMVHSPNVNGSLVSDTINGYPLSWTPQYMVTNSSIQYVSGVPGDFTSTPAPTGYNQYQFTQNAMASGAFGIVAEYHGAFLLERGYHGSPVLFSPMHYPTVPYGKMFALNSSAISAGGLQISNAINVTVIPSAAFLLYPGTYSLRLNLSNVSLDAPSSVQFRLSADNVAGNIMVASSQIDSGQNSVIVNFTLDNFYASADLFMTGLNLYGTVTIQSMSIQETEA